MRTLDEIRPGQSIGRYEFLVPIARGGMAAVWVARLKGSRGFSRTVAIKTMLPTLSDEPLFEDMFLDEARIAAQIRHPNVVEIIDLGEEDEVLYQVMEYVDGESLSMLLRTSAKKREPIPLQVSIKLTLDALSGLHAAHELRDVNGELVGLVHRDISPQNILVSYDGAVKLVDFGVAKAAGRTASETTAGQIKGKAPYMAPEHVLGQSVDRRSDLFAMGIVLYQLTTGRHPFRGESDVVTLHNILHREMPSPRKENPQFPRPLEAVLLKALERDPTKRFSTALEMAEALEKVLPPPKRMASTSEVAAYLQKLFGSLRTKRNDALREAIRRADARASAVPGTELTGLVMVPLSELNNAELSGSRASLLPNTASGPSGPSQLSEHKSDIEYVRQLASSHTLAPTPPMPSVVEIEALTSGVRTSGSSIDALAKDSQQSPPSSKSWSRPKRWAIATTIGLMGMLTLVLSWHRMRTATTTEPAAAVQSSPVLPLQEAAPNPAPTPVASAPEQALTEPAADAGLSQEELNRAVQGHGDKGQKPSKHAGKESHQSADPREQAPLDPNWKPPPVTNPGF